MPTVQLDGNDSELLLDRIGPIVEKIRAGSGPVFIEIETYRQSAHVGPGSDDSLEYRAAEEIELWKARDPVVNMRKLLINDIEAGDLGPVFS